MDQPNQPQVPEPNPTPHPASRSTAFSFRYLIPGILLGVLIGIVGFLAYQNQLPVVTQTLFTVTLVSFGVLILTFVLLFGFRQYLTRFLFGANTANAGDLMADAQRISDALTDQFADKLLNTAPADVRQRVRYLLPRLANWFVWGRLRNWWWNWILGIFVSLGGLTGTLLLMNQNELLQTQNEMIQRQMQLEEANRRSALVMLMSNIFDKVDREIESQQTGLSILQKEKKEYTLSNSLIGQIAALSHSFKPYRYLEGDSLIITPLSPERGQLLITLVFLPLDTPTLEKIFLVSTFANAELKNAHLENANLRGAHLEHSDLRSAWLANADLSKSFLSGAKLNNAWLPGAHLNFTFLDNANLSEAILDAAEMKYAKLGNADLQKTHFFAVNLSNTSLLRANLSGADFSYSNLHNAELGETNLNGTIITLEQLQQSGTLYNTKNMSDSLKSGLVQNHPQLLEKPEWWDTILW